MRTLSLLVVGALLATSPQGVWASEQGGKVTRVAIGSTPPSAFGVDGTRTAMPACATDGSWVIAPTSDDSSKEMFSAVLTAFAAGKKITVVGTGNCSVLQPMREQVLYIVVE